LRDDDRTCLRTEIDRVLQRICREPCRKGASVGVLELSEEGVLYVRAENGCFDCFIMRFLLQRRLNELLPVAYRSVHRVEVVPFGFGLGGRNREREGRKRGKG
jgi:hypothetical protein